MSKTTSQKTMQTLQETERVADKILVNKQEIISLDKRRQELREAVRELKKSDEHKIWTSVGSMLIKMKKTESIQLLEKDQKQIENEINILRSHQKILVNEHRDLEFTSPFSGTNLKPLEAKEMQGLKANLPFFS